MFYNFISCNNVYFQRKVNAKMLVTFRLSIVNMIKAVCVYGWLLWSCYWSANNDVDNV